MKKQSKQSKRTHTCEEDHPIFHTSFKIKVIIKSTSLMGLFKNTCRRLSSLLCGVFLSLRFIPPSFIALSGRRPEMRRQRGDERDVCKRVLLLLLCLLLSSCSQTHSHGRAQKHTSDTKLCLHSETLLWPYLTMTQLLSCCPWSSGVSGAPPPPRLQLTCWGKSDTCPWV